MRTLDKLLVGEKGVIEELFIEGSMRRRLLDLGVVTGTIVECVMKSPLKDPTAYFIRGALIAIRMDDAKKIKICEVDFDGEVRE